jgi:hypothetical protein
VENFSSLSDIPGEKQRKNVDLESVTLESRNLALTRTLNQEKYTFTSIIRVSVIRMEHVRAPSKGLSTRNVLCMGIMVI